ncbi:hypothetical protein ACVWYG_002319 [Pedobacter sp. UYEF25]
MEVSEWKNQVKKNLEERGILFFEVTDSIFYLIALQNFKIVINLIGIKDRFSPQQIIDLENREEFKSCRFVRLWEDVWTLKPTLVIDRFCSFCKLNTSIHGRKTHFERISKPVAEAFLNVNHLQGYASSRFKYGLFLQQQLVAVATFSSTRKMNYGEEYLSIELIRFAVKSGCSVIGGLSKLIMGHYRLHPTTDIMTYIDRDWGKGLAFEQLGFKQVDATAPQFFRLSEDFQRNKASSSLINGDVFNAGSIKMILKFENDYV